MDLNFLNSPDNNFYNIQDSPKILSKFFDNNLEDNQYYDYTDPIYLPSLPDLGLIQYFNSDSSTNLQSSVNKKQEMPKVIEKNPSISEVFEEKDNFLKDESNNNDDNNKKKTILGRPKKDNPRNGKHSRTSKDNGIKVLIKSCSKSIHNSLQKEVQTFIGKKRDIHGKIINYKLHVPTINKYLVKGNKEKNVLFNSDVKSIYYDTIPKRVKNKIKNDKEKYSYNKDVLNNILKIEEEDNRIVQKQLNMKFNAKFKLYLEAYLKNKKNITINGQNFELNDEFKTLNDCFNEGENRYTREEKEGFKNHLNKIILKTVKKKIKKVNKEIKCILINLND